MTAPRELDREFRAYFDGQAVGRAPDGLLDTALAGVALTRQRPRLLIAGWWLPRRTVSRPNLGPRVFAMVALVLLLIAFATALLLIGSSRRPAPPFGLAKPGLIAFDADGDLFASKPDGSGFVRLTSGPEFDVLATYSPDGMLIAFESQQPDFSFDVVVMPADGGERVRVIEGLADTVPIAWSPDGSRVAVAARPVGEDAEDKQQILIGSINDPGGVRLGGPDVFGSDPTWSPDGRQIAFHRRACCGDPLDSLWVIDVDGSNAHEVAPSIWNSRVQGMFSPTKSNRTGTGVQPAWSADGRRLAFLAQGVAHRRDVHIVEPDGRNLRNISNTPDEEYRVAWSPDGTRLAYVAKDLSNGDASFMVTDADGLNARPVPDPGLSPDLLIWSPDGTRLLGMAFADPEKGLNANQNTVIELDPSGHVAPVTTQIANFGTASYQRLAP